MLGLQEYLFNISKPYDETAAKIAKSLSQTFRIPEMEDQYHKWSKEMSTNATEIIDFQVKKAQMLQPPDKPKPVSLAIEKTITTPSKIIKGILPDYQTCSGRTSWDSLINVASALSISGTSG